MVKGTLWKNLQKKSKFQRRKIWFFQIFWRILTDFFSFWRRRAIPFFLMKKEKPSKKQKIIIIQKDISFSAVVRRLHLPDESGLPEAVRRGLRLHTADLRTSRKEVGKLQKRAGRGRKKTLREKKKKRVAVADEEEGDARECVGGRELYWKEKRSISSLTCIVQYRECCCKSSATSNGVEQKAWVKKKKVGTKDEEDGGDQGVGGLWGIGDSRGFRHLCLLLEAASCSQRWSGSSTCSSCAAC